MTETSMPENVESLCFSDWTRGDNLMTFNDWKNDFHNSKTYVQW